MTANMRARADEVDQAADIVERTDPDLAAHLRVLAVELRGLADR